MTHKRKPNRSFRIESLENRELMAGDVVAFVDASTNTLHITGDTDNNAIQIVEQPNGNKRIEGRSLGSEFGNRSATTINGQQAIEFSFRGDLKVNMGAGGDHVEFLGQQLPARGQGLNNVNADFSRMVVDMGAASPSGTAAERVVVSHLKTSGGLFVNVDPAAVNSTVGIRHSYIGSDLKITNAHSVRMENSTVKRHMVIKAVPNESVSVNIDRAFAGFGRTVGGTLKIRGGSESDRIQLFSIRAAAVDIALKAGNDVLFLESTQGGQNNLGTGTIKFGSGNQDQFINGRQLRGTAVVTGFERIN